MNTGDAVRFRIVELCEERNITINKLSIICGITQSTMSNIMLRNCSCPKVSTIKKICDGLEITLKEFFDTPMFDNLEQEIR